MGPVRPDFWARCLRKYTNSCKLSRQCPQWSFVLYRSPWSLMSSQFWLNFSRHISSSIPMESFSELMFRQRGQSHTWSNLHFKKSSVLLPVSKVRDLWWGANGNATSESSGIRVVGLLCPVLILPFTSSLINKGFLSVMREKMHRAVICSPLLSLFAQDGHLPSHPVALWFKLFFRGLNWNMLCCRLW